MTPTIVTRWEELRELTGGGQRHRAAVRLWLETHPALLYWGDSWFSTPLYPNLARHSAWRVDGLRMIVGKPGATASSLLSARHIDAMTKRLTHNPFDVLVLSAGGNDALGERLQQVFADWMHGSPAKLSAADAFQKLVDSKLFLRLLGRYQKLLRTIETDVRPRRPHFRVIGQSYAPLVRIGVAGDLSVSNIGLIAILKDDIGPWLYGPMKKVLRDTASASEFARLLLIDGFRDQVLVAAEREFSGLFSFADLSAVPELTSAAHWYDEIHPTGDGFAACAGTLNASIRQALPAGKRGAVQ